MAVENLITAFDTFFSRQNKRFILIWRQMQYIEQFVEERQEIKPLRTCVSYYVTFQWNLHVYGVSVIRFALQQIFHVDTSFFTDTDSMRVCTCLSEGWVPVLRPPLLNRPCGCALPLVCSSRIRRPPPASRPCHSQSTPPTGRGFATETGKIQI